MLEMKIKFINSADFADYQGPVCQRFGQPETRITTFPHTIHIVQCGEILLGGSVSSFEKCSFSLEEWID